MPHDGSVAHKAQNDTGSCMSDVVQNSHTCDVILTPALAQEGEERRAFIALLVKNKRAALVSRPFVSVE